MIGSYILNYKILQKIGEGGMGTVYLAKHTTLGRMVAIKVLLPEFTQNSEIINRFINEAKTLSKLSHRNIVTLYDFEEKEGNLFIIMEYIEGVSLDKHITDSNQTDEKQAINIFSQILDGFEYAHSKGVVHRDIKPSNIILNTEGIPKILDFGIAKIVQGDIRLTKTGMKMGSVLYMSPEQILGKDVDLRSDIYSLGITLYELLTSRNPYDKEFKSEYQIQNDIINSPVPLISDYNPNISNNTQQIIYVATAKDPSARFQCCSDFKDALFQNTVSNKYTNDYGNNSNDVYSFTQSKQTDFNRTVVQNIQIQNRQENHVKQNKTYIYMILIAAFIAIIGTIIYIKYYSEPTIVVKDLTNNTKETVPVPINKDMGKANDKDKNEIVNVVNDMLNAWQNKDIEGFFNHLSSDYEYKSSEGVYRTYSSRKSKAYEIFANNRSIIMTTWDMTVDINGTEAVVRFMQKYNSTTVNETTVKKFYLRKSSNTWLVYKELSGYN